MFMLFEDRNLIKNIKYDIEELDYLYVNWDHNILELYTLVIYDTTNKTTNGLYVNIKGNDVFNSNCIVNYMCRGHSEITYYTFSIYKQTKAFTSIKNITYDNINDYISLLGQIFICVDPINKNYFITESF